MSDYPEEVLHRPGGYPCLLVPKNKQGISELDSDSEDENNIRWCSLRDEENTALSPVFARLNKSLQLEIGSYENERISATCAPEALEIVKLCLSQPESKTQLAALGKLKRALEAAIDYGTFLELAL